MQATSDARWHRISLGGIAALIALAGTIGACAHPPPARSWTALGSRVAPGNPVAVIEGSGAEVRGRVASVSASALTLNVDGAQRRFEPKDVAQVRRDGDPLWNGLAIGAGIGAFGVLLNDTHCSGRSYPCNDAPERIAFFATMTAAGVALDALHRDRTVLYTAPNRTTLRIVPLAGRDGASLSVRIDFARRRIASTDEHAR